MRYDIVLFDADGTLLDFHRSEREAVKEALAMSGIDADSEMIQKYSEINDGLWKMLERKEIERSVLLYRRFEIFCEYYGYCADAKKIALDYMNTLATKGYLLDGAEKLLQSLSGKVKMYIVTNGVEFIQRERYARTGIGKFFDGLFISEAIGFNKPDARYFEYVAEHIQGFERSRALVVGDSLTSDIRGGINAGIDTCWYNPDGKANTADVCPDFTAYDFDSVYNIIAGEGKH